MDTPGQDARFGGSIPKLYDQLLVPMIFEPYAENLARLAAALSPARVLEIAAGTGAVTRKLASMLPGDTSIVATDLNPPMLALAEQIGTARPVQWRQADALQLPFAESEFDLVICQFGAMFFPDKVKAYTEAKRVLRPGGAFLFNTWDRIEENEFADTVTTALASVFPADPPRFMARTPHGYFDPVIIARQLADAGFATPPRITTVAARSRAESARIVAVAYCQGTLTRSEIEARDASRLGEATDAAEAALAGRFGRGAVDGKIQAHVVMVNRVKANPRPC